MFRSIKPLFWIPAAIFAVAMALSLAAFVDFCDTLWFMEYFKPYIRGEVDSPRGAIWETWRFHWLTDNVRLSNVIFTLSLALPEWVDWPLFAFGFLAWTILTARLAGLSPRSPYAAAAAIACVAFAPMWQGIMADECYIYNYSLATPLALYAIWLYLHADRYSSAAMFLWGLALGWWHEGFAAPVLAGLAVATAIWYRRPLPRKRLWLMAGICLGLLILVSAPGTYDRIDYFNDVEYVTVAELKRIYSASVIMMAGFAALYIRPSIRRRVSFTLPVILTVATVAVFTINMLFQTARAGWLAPALSSVGILYIGNIVLPWLRQAAAAARTAVRAIAVLLAAVALVKTTLGAIGAFELRPYIDEAYARGAMLPEPKAKEEVQVFTPLASPFDSAAKFVAWPYYRYAMCSGWARNISCVYAHDIDACYVFHPEQMEYATADTGEAVPGTPGLRRTGNLFFYALDDFAGTKPGAWITATIHFGGFHRVMALPLTQVVSKADGRTYVYILPDKTGRIIPRHGPGDMEIHSWHTREGAVVTTR
ncbi:MAG: DUF6056 family protein [Bacteroides sp.]|nr:DUF6056 family protein [Bacteroides sp.]MCM1095634.1 DUF6056 family protein [Terasakiella sp.]